MHRSLAIRKIPFVMSDHIKLSMHHRSLCTSRTEPQSCSKGLKLGLHYLR